MRLHRGPCDSLEVEQAGARTDKRGQFVLQVDDCRHDPDDLFQSAHAAEQAGDIAEAERLYRILTKGHPADPSAAFNLGNMLRAHGRNVEAEAALRTATRIDPSFAEAWYNLGDLLGDQGRAGAAIECCARRCRPRLNTATQCSTWLFCCNEATNAARLRLLAALSRYRQPIGMGQPRAPIT